MNITTSIPPTMQIRRSHLFGVVAAVAALTAATTWAAGVAIDASPEPAETRAPTRETVLAGLGPNQRQYVESIMAMTPAQLVATFGTEPVDHPSPNTKDISTTTAVLSSLGPNQRQYVESIMAMNPAQLVATFGTEPVDHPSPNTRDISTTTAVLSSLGPNQRQ